MNIQFENLAKQKGFDSLSDLARAMGKAPNLFFSNLRYLAETGSYTSKFAKSLFEALRISESEFKAVIEGRAITAKRSELTRIIDRKAAVVFEEKPSQAKDIIEMMASLEKGDIYTLVTRKLPLEFSDAAFKRVMVEAASRGAIFRYIFPMKETCEQTDVRLSLDVETLLPSIFEMFVQNLEHIHAIMLSEQKHIRLPENLGELSENIAELSENIAENFMMSRSSDPLLMNPLHAYISLEQCVEGKPMYFVLEEISSGKASTLYGVENAVLWYPLIPSAGGFIAEKINYEFMGGKPKVKTPKRPKR